MRRGALAVALLCAVATPAPAAPPAATSGPSALAAALTGSASAPRFRVRSVEGASLELERLLERGPVLLDFWATWCRPCLAELPELQQLHARYAERGLTVIGISIDGPRNFAKVRPFVQRLGLTFPVALDEDGSLQQRFHVSAAPTTVLIDRDGRIARTTTGYLSGEGARLEQAVVALLADSTGTGEPAK